MANVLHIFVLPNSHCICVIQPSRAFSNLGTLVWDRLYGSNQTLPIDQDYTIFFHGISEIMSQFG
jgi:hypothetical protein